MAKQKTYTKQIGIRLDLSKPEELGLYENIVAWKSQRRFTPLLRNALRLIADLEAGNTDVLQELYPAVGRVLASELQSEEVRELARAVKSLADAVKVNEGTRQRGASLPRSNHPTGLNDPLDVSDVVVTAAKGEKGKAAQNLAKGLMGFSV